MSYIMQWTSDTDFNIGIDDIGIENSGDAKTVREALCDGRNYLRGYVDSPDVDAGVLLAHVLGISYSLLGLNLETHLSAFLYKVYISLVKKRLKKYPLQYITGVQSFFSMEFFVTPDVFIPRFETEQLVEESIRRLLRIRGKTAPACVVPGKDLFDGDIICMDICTGAGNIPVAIKSVFHGAKVFATDIYPPACKTAEINTSRFGQGDSIEIFRGSLFAPLVGLGLEEKVDIIISNPPYISMQDMSHLPDEIKLYESHIALNGGKDGTEIICAIVKAAPIFLKKGGLLAMEIGDTQGRNVLDCVNTNGHFKEVEISQDLSGRDRFVFAIRK